MASDGASLFGHVHAAKLLVQDAGSVLVLGGAGGSLASMLARRGRQVTVVDVDPVARHLAERYFALDRRVRWVTQDAATFLTQTREVFDAIIVDVCDARGSVASFATPDTVARAFRRLTSAGSIVLNLRLISWNSIPGNWPASSPAAVMASRFTGQCSAAKPTNCFRSDLTAGRFEC